jgi:LuxR family maltose regulon positive regulatory protein
VAGTDASVVVVHAPAGYGKSTLLRQVAEHERRRVAWLSLAASDDDVVALLRRLDAALRGPDGDEPGPPSRALPRGPGAVAVYVPRLIAGLRSLGDPLVLILDDVHHIRSREGLDVLGALCEGIGEGATLVLSGRARPPLALARLGASGRLLELTAGDLRMTPAEGAALLRASSADVDDEQATLVVERTEGWPAALYLAALSLRHDGGDTPAHTDAAGGDEALIAYVREQVLRELGEDDARFLLETSLLEELTPALCDAVLERGDSAARLRELADAGLFVTSVDLREPRYRVHGLFRAMLRAELRATHPERERDLHLRASEFFDGTGDAEQAILHAAAAGDAGRTADLVWMATAEHIARGRTATLRRWCSLLTEHQAAAHPQIEITRGWAALEDGDVVTASHCAAVVLGAPGDARLPDGESRHAVGLLLHASIGAQGPARAATEAQEADAELLPDSPLRSVARFLMGSGAMLAGDLDRAERLLREAECLGAGRLATGYVLALAQLALVAADGDRWDEAIALMHRAVAFQRMHGIEDYGPQVLVTATSALALAREGAPAAAREAAKRAARNLALLGETIPWIALEGRLVLARAHVALADGPAARALLDESRGLMRVAPSPTLLRWADAATDALEALHGSGDAADVLTTAELRTFQYLPTHLSIREIGERLQVSRNTVKTHTYSIYRKLEVGSRSEAVERGRELGLLDD